MSQFQKRACTICWLIFKQRQREVAIRNDRARNKDGARYRKLNETWAAHRLVLDTCVPPTWHRMQPYPVQAIKWASQRIENANSLEVVQTPPAVKMLMTCFVKWGPALAQFRQRTRFRFLNRCCANCCDPPMYLCILPECYKRMKLWNRCWANCSNAPEARLTETTIGSCQIEWDQAGPLWK